MSFDNFFPNLNVQTFDLRKQIIEQSLQRCEEQCDESIEVSSGLMHQYTVLRAQYERACNTLHHGFGSIRDEDASPYDRESYLDDDELSRIDSIRKTLRSLESAIRRVSALRKRQGALAVILRNVLREEEKKHIDSANTNTRRLGLLVARAIQAGEKRKREAATAEAAATAAAAELHTSRQSERGTAAPRLNLNLNWVSKPPAARPFVNFT